MNIGYGLNRASFSALAKDIKKIGFFFVPVLIGVFPILSLYARNVTEVPTNLIYQPMIIVLLGSIIGTMFLWRAWKNKIKASIVISLFWVFFYLYIPILQSTNNLVSANLENFDSILLPLWFLIFVLLSFMLLKSKKTHLATYKFIIVVATTLCGMQIISLVNYHLLATPEDNTKYLDNIEKLSLNSTVNLPNIYFITPDSYPRSDTLKGYFNFDNSEFDNELERLNFKVLSKSNSNYNHTGLSLPTTFNMSYFTTKGDIDGDEVIELYNNNLAYEYLKSGGYKLRNNSSYFSTAYNSYADSNANCRGGNEFLTELIPTTPLRSFSLITDTQRAAKRKDILCTIDNIGSSLKYSSPIFEVTHLIAPHPPYVFNENGEDTTEMHLSLTGIDRWYAKEPYVAQLKYVNKRLVESVTKILDSSQNSIIIIQSDHGTLSSASREKEIGDMRPEVLKERSRNYTAIYLPEYCDGSQLYDSITNVNTLRIVFNACFDAGFQILEDRVYFAPAKITNLNFRDITNIVR